MRLDSLVSASSARAPAFGASHALLRRCWPAVLAGLLIAALGPGRRPASSPTTSPSSSTLPEAVGADRRALQPRRRTRCTSRRATGLGIYDVSRPEAPQRLSRLPLPHFENEDVDVGHIGGRDYVIITNDPSFTGVGVIYVIDVTDPRAPSLASATPVEVPGLNGVAHTPGSSNGHIANCVAGCRYLWTTGSSEGLTVFDLADPHQAAVPGRLQGARAAASPTTSRSTTPGSRGSPARTGPSATTSRR